MRHLSATGGQGSASDGAIAEAPAARPPREDPQVELAQLYISGSPKVGAARGGAPAAARTVAPSLRLELDFPGRRRPGVLAVLLPLCVLLTGGGLGAYVWWFLHSIPMACMIAALGLVGAAFCRQLLR